MKTIKKVKNETINIVQCEGAICVSTNQNDSRYYAPEISSRVLDIKRYRV